MNVFFYPAKDGTVLIENLLAELPNNHGGMSLKCEGLTELHQRWVALHYCSGLSYRQEQDMRVWAALCGTNHIIVRTGPGNTLTHIPNQSKLIRLFIFLLVASTDVTVSRIILQLRWGSRRCPSLPVLDQSGV